MTVLQPKVIKNKQLDHQVVVQNLLYSAGFLI